MQNQPGVFIVLEGPDGSGKGTQFRLLRERLKAVGQDVAVFDFPRYDEPSSHFVKRYLNGDYGPAGEISPYTASIFYALDRYEASPNIKKALAEGRVVLANRYVGSNMAHQGTKFSDLAQQRGFFMWAESLEYQLLGIPRPSINLFLSVPANIAFELIATKSERNYTKKKRDEHEADKGHIEKAVAAYDLLCNLFPKDFRKIDCSRGGKMLGVVRINNMIWESIKPLLPTPKYKGKGATVNLGNSTSSPLAETKPSHNRSEPKGTINNNRKFDKILALQKQMLDKAKALPKIDHDRLKTAIYLVSPLITRRRDIDAIFQEKIVTKTSNDDPVSLHKIIDKLSDSISAPNDTEKLKLIQSIPKNEFQLLDSREVNGLRYQQKQQLLNNRLKTSADQLVYVFECITDFNLLLCFKSEVNVRHLEILGAGPALGHSEPQIIEASSLDEQFDKVFQISDELYRKALLNKKQDLIFNLLLGHNVRWKFEADAAALSSTLKKSKNPQLQELISLSIDKIGVNHPNTARMMSQKAFG